MTTPSWHAFLGSWQGHGVGSYPHFGQFRYLERTQLALEEEWGMVHVLQRTWLLDEHGHVKRPLHLEAGIIVPKDEGALEFGCGQDSGRIESMSGTPVASKDGDVEIDWATTAHGNDPRLVKMGRVWGLRGSKFIYQAFMSSVRTPEYRQHLEATLSRE
jgi:hypothetical protein